MIDPLEVPRQALADAGVDLTVQPLSCAESFVVTALLGHAAESVGLGTARGHLGAPVFQVDPDEAGRLEEGDLLTAAYGETYAIADLVAVPGRLCAVHVVER